MIYDRTSVDDPKLNHMKTKFIQKEKEKKKKKKTHDICMYLPNPI